MACSRKGGVGLWRLQDLPDGFLTVNLAVDTEGRFEEVDDTAGAGDAAGSSTSMGSGAGASSVTGSGAGAGAGAGAQTGLTVPK